MTGSGPKTKSTERKRLFNSMGYSNTRNNIGTWSRLSNTQQLTARGTAILFGCTILAGVLGASRRGGEDPARVFAGTLSLATLSFSSQSVDSVPDRLVELEAQRARTLNDYSARFDVSNDLAGLIYDVAIQAGIDPELGFRVVYAESRFNPRAVSSAGALGLAQLMPATARIFNPTLEREDLFDSEINLRIGFRYLRTMVDRYDGDLSLALLAYNRGPTRLKALLEGGLDPRNGYASSVLKGYSPAVSENQ